MVKHVVFVLLAVAASSRVAGAHRLEESPPPPPDDSVTEDDDPGFNMFGFDFSGGVQPYDGKNALATTLGLSVEHPVFTKTRVFGEYAWLWLSPREDTTDLMATTLRATEIDRHASGHRATLGLRRELKAKGSSSFRLFLDGELGANAALLNDSVTGTVLLPAGFVGVRAGYDLYSQRENSPSRTFETALFFRATGSQYGVGFAFGLGMYWGN
jgi:hypothetical protein